MNDERWRRVEEICHDALERPGHDVRNSFTPRARAMSRCV